MPFHDSYQTKLQIIAKWVGMDHMHPTTVVVPLPGARPDDKSRSQHFDFVSQSRSLLSDKEPNTPEQLVVNATDLFACYHPPDGLLGICHSGSWYWSHMETSTKRNFMIPVIL